MLNADGERKGGISSSTDQSVIGVEFILNTYRYWL